MAGAKPADAERKPALVTALRDAIKASGKSHNALAKEAGVTTTNVHRFMAGSGITLETAGRIAAVLGYGLNKLDDAKTHK